jgi:hypothetical protein
MTDTTHKAAIRPPLVDTPPRTGKPRAPIWILGGLAVVIAAIIAALLLWSDKEKPLSGDLIWSIAPEAPAAQLTAITATDDGFLAASPANGGGIDFWRSDDGYIWKFAGTESEAFKATEIVQELNYGEAGYSAVVVDRFPEEQAVEGSNLAWTSNDGTKWTRSELVADMPDRASPYLVEMTFVGGVVGGPSGYIAYGHGAHVADFDAIVADFAPELGEEFMVGWGFEEGSAGYEFHVAVGDDFVAIPIADLGFTEEDVMKDLSGEALQPFMWWSSDGIDWEPVSLETTALRTATEFTTATATNDAFYAFGFGPKSPAVADMPPFPSHATYRSEDGRTWEELGVTGLATPAWIHDVNVLEDLFVAVGAEDFGGAVWTSPDAQSWTRLPDSAFLDLGRPNTEFGLDQVTAGKAGLLATGVAHSETAEDFEPPQIVISKDGYAVTWDDMTITLASESTGDVIAEIDMGAFESQTVNIVEDERGGFTFVDTTTGERLLILSGEEIQAAAEDAFASAGIALTPPAVLRYSVDARTWTLDDVPALFGEGSFVISAAVGSDSVVAVVAADMEAWMMWAFGEGDLADLPASEVWVGNARG